MEMLRISQTCKKKNAGSESGSVHLECSSIMLKKVLESFKMSVLKMRYGDTSNWMLQTGADGIPQETCKKSPSTGFANLLKQLILCIRNSQKLETKDIARKILSRECIDKSVGIL